MSESGKVQFDAAEGRVKPWSKTAHDFPTEMLMDQKVNPDPKGELCLSVQQNSLSNDETPPCSIGLISVSKRLTAIRCSTLHHHDTDASRLLIR